VRWQQLFRTCLGEVILAEAVMMSPTLLWIILALTTVHYTQGKYNSYIIHCTVTAQRIVH